ncbi:MAG TPA: DUF3795 domain-containing protein [Anaerolineaceae bacterium]|nr:DUF3795 domain-containing protein [Anaerolineaceae bacterium]
MKMVEEIPAAMIAPCGITCQACYAHLRKKKPCPGCRSTQADKPAYCQRCKIRACAGGRGLDFCSSCPSFPCALIKNIDKRYRTRYQTGLIANLVRLQSAGAPQYLAEEMARWACPHCGGVISLHERVCSECGKEAL